MSVTPDIIAAAQASQAKWGIPAAISLAQYGIESAWGTREPPGSNNGFGIKAVAGQPSITVPTREFEGGRYVTIDAAFAVYPSVAGAFDAHAELLATSHYYAAARAAISGGITDASTDAFANALTGVYATAPNYGASLIALMKVDNLYQYDAPIAQAAPVEVPPITREPSQPLAKPTPPVVTPVRVAATVIAGAVIASGGATLTTLHGIDLTPILNPLIQTAGLILTGFASWALAMVANYAHVSKQSALLQNVLGAVDRGISYAQNQATTYADGHGTIMPTTSTEQTAVNYVVSKMPGALKSLGMSPAHVADLVVAKLPVSP